MPADIDIGLLFIRSYYCYSINFQQFRVQLQPPKAVIMWNGKLIYLAFY